MNISLENEFDVNKYIAKYSLTAFIGIFHLLLGKMSSMTIIVLFL